MDDSEDSQDNTNPIKITVSMCGCSGVGKTSIIERFDHNNFETNMQPTIGCAFKKIKINSEGNELDFSIWDTAGQEIFHSISRQYYHNTNIAIIVYDISNRKSFLKLNFWHKEVVENAQTNVKFLIIGNKSDLVKKRAVSFEEGQEFAEKKYSSFIETSAKNNENIQLVIAQLIEIVNHNKESIVKQIQDSQLDLQIKIKKQQDEIHKKSGCC
ncbi:rab gtpase [Anaeramoeba flamelloides]|uniref:Rab gtpase n=1 Tax=Anaeramoeba flamelloides TaxID=1746091 RepID=A0AAV7Z2E5_9EUKA|nr:rab gtpase [Anaeramoeba flamelloides]